MHTIVGLGQAGCRIAEGFRRYKNYDIYKIDTGIEDSKWTYSLPQQAHPEMYEEHCPNLDEFFKDIEGEVLFILSGGGLISGCALRVLEGLKKNTINILYVRPDISFLSPIRKLHERVVFNVLQEYARSAVFKRLLIVDNATLEKNIGNIPVVGFYERINEAITPVIHMLNVFGHIDSVEDNFSDPLETCRISTIGMYEFDSGEENMFFPLEKTREVCYYYAINKKELESDGTLMNKIKKQLKEKNKDLKISYGIFSTNYPKKYVYVMSHSSTIQKGEEDVKSESV